MKRRLIVLVAVLAIVLAACGSSGNPESFVDQPGPLPESLKGFATQLVGTADPDLVPLVQRNFLEGCMIEGALKFDDLSGARLASACGCSYGSLVDDLDSNTVPPQTAFETFLAIDRTLKNDGVVDSRYAALFEDCRA